MNLRGLANIKGEKQRMVVESKLWQVPMRGQRVKEDESISGEEVQA